MAKETNTEVLECPKCSKELTIHIKTVVKPLLKNVQNTVWIKNE